MPFAQGTRFEVTNDSDKDSFLYFYVDFEEWDQSGSDLGRFHANWKR